MAVRQSPDFADNIEVAFKTLHDDIYRNSLVQRKQRQETELHIVMMPYPLQGHINPMMQFAKVLIDRYPVKVSFINIKHHHNRIRQALCTTSASSCADALHGSTSSLRNSYNPHKEEYFGGKLQLLSLEDGLPEGFNYADILPGIHQLHVTSEKMREPLKELLEKLHQRHSVACVVFGSFWPWIHSVSSDLRIPTFFFWTQSAAVFSVYYHLPLLHANGFFPYNTEAKCIEGSENPKAAISDNLEYIPGLPPLSISSTPTLFHVNSMDDPLLALIREQLEILQNCDGLIINTFEELERYAYRALREEVPCPVSLVGPLVPSASLEEGFVNVVSVRSSLFSESTECLEWLNKHKKHSVLYISFGSMCTPSVEDLQSIANGVKDSGRPFLWVLRPLSFTRTLADMLPEGFIESTRDRGLIIPWAPQLEVLAHPAVGGFLTHCGWNSTLEALSMGVPLVPFPILSDQPTNCTFVCDVWKIGVPLRRNVQQKLESSDVDRAVRAVLGEEGELLRKRAMDLRESATMAVRPSGSSSNHIEDFISNLRKCRDGVRPSGLSSNHIEDFMSNLRKSRDGVNQLSRIVPNAHITN
ncbi:hypothetical protein KP509_12G045000 [Ceratopteris richardii]|uniref:Glycosyltransferase n=1 Tax=Ceratopteris richardii TaxID=49495 RepID=A0A8T2TP65_CERRI|nr:hypothetical protein KP509_12G045000 [Ceratopteris richardii]